MVIEYLRRCKWRWKGCKPQLRRKRRKEFCWQSRKISCTVIPATWFSSVYYCHLICIYIGLMVLVFFVLLSTIHELAFRLLILDCKSSMQFVTFQNASIFINFDSDYVVLSWQEYLECGNKSMQYLSCSTFLLCFFFGGDFLKIFLL